MITLLTGENSFENERELRRLAAEFNGSAERVDGSELELRQLPDFLMGATLFADKRLVIIKNLSENKTLWSTLETWIGRVSDDVHIVLVERKPDKRTKTYKELQKVARLHESKLWSERDTLKAEQWVAGEAKVLGFDLDKKSAHVLVVRVGVDQWLLYRALEKLAVVETVSPAVIEELIAASPTENVFNLLDAALKGDVSKMKKMLKTLETTEEPYRLFGLLSGQAFWLAALSVAEKPLAEVARELMAHPFTLSKLASYAKKLDKTDIKNVIAAFAEADNAMKTSAAEPWLLIERALLKVARL